MTAGLEALAAIVAVGAITPGPNNGVVLRTAAREGWRGAARAIAGVVLGTVALLGAVALGLGALIGAAPWSRSAIACGGALYLGWLGAALALQRKAAEPGAEAKLPAGVGGLFAFQFLNPKGWVLTITAVAAAGASGASSALSQLVPLFVGIPAVCLTLWASVGAALTRLLRGPDAVRWLDRVLGGLLFASALLLLLEI